MNSPDDKMSAFTLLARSFLASNPRLLDSLVMMLHNVAEELDSLKDSRMISSGRYIQPYKFKKKVVDKVMRKLGYQSEDIADLCSQGRGDELLQEIDRLEKVPLVGSSNPSRRALPIALVSTRSKQPRFEDVTDGSKR